MKFYQRKGPSENFLGVSMQLMKVLVKVSILFKKSNENTAFRYYLIKVQLSTLNSQY